jgi:hypothetical protein
MLQWIKSQQNFLKKTVTVLGFILVTGFFVLLNQQTAHAQTTSPVPSGGSAAAELQAGLDVIEQPLGLPTDDIRLVVARIIRVALGLLGIIMVVLIMYGGYLWMTAGGNGDQVDKAKKVLTNAAIGLAIILSAYAIVAFVMRLFGIGDGGLGSGGGGGGTSTENFQGSGALGGVIKDHYPMRDQADVPRNTKIIITFRKPIKAESFIVNTNNSKDKDGKEIFGDCINIGDRMNWKTDCDSAVLDEEHISVRRADTNEPISGASVLAQVQDGKIYTIVIRPYDYLGSNTDKIAYKVRLGKAMQLDDPANNNPSVFSSKIVGNDYYEWQFTCSTALDTDPPFVNSIFPGDKSIEAKNTVIQIDFSEAMDPTGIQGTFKVDGGNYVLEGGNIFLKNNNSTVPLGNFTLTNGYRTLEFTSSQECGKNACGNNIYCLPVCDKPGAACSSDAYELLVKAAKTFNVTSFEAIPFSGAMDVASNALDGNKNKKIDVASSTGPVFPDHKKPDNYFWGFTLSNTIDSSAPYLKQVTPGLDATYVNPRDDVRMLFSKRMRVDPMYTIGIEQHPPQTIPLCRVPSAVFNDLDNTTLTSLIHCPFLQGAGRYYMPIVDSQVEDVHFNCFFPGKGPGGKEEINKRLKESSVCDASGKNCCAVSSSTPNNAYCCNGLVSPTQDTTATCLQGLRATSL